MSCPNGGSGSGITEEYLNLINSINNRNRIRNRNCTRSFLPNFTPNLFSLSVTSSPYGTYSLVYVDGSNFLPNETTYIQFGGFEELPVTYYSSWNLSFVVPLNAPIGNYSVKVVNLYNGNFSQKVNETYGGSLNYSNSITYTIT